MRYTIIISAIMAALGLVSCQNLKTQDSTPKTTFQTGRGWSPMIDTRADAVMVYGIGGNPSDRGNISSIESRIQSWRERGYTADYMTGIAWGEYQDYFTGEWDGKMHLDEGQVTMKGDTIWHGHMVPYIVPSENYLEYLKERHIKRVIDAGVSAIYLEEPEFWARAGYSESFKREWQDFYGAEWRPQHESPEATYMSGKLKYHLYLRALDECFTFAKEYGKSKGMDVKCYVPTHSLLNYSQWQIVSPEASLASLPNVDGYIAQVWTGTSREPNFYNGKRRERVFETAYLEYCSMQSMTAPTGRKVWFLTDPIEDWPRDWEDYRRNYHATFTAQLLFPQIADFEIMPWPGRIYGGTYRKSADSDEKIRIPKDYATMMQIMVNSLNDVPVTDNEVSGSQGFSVLMANSLMFQRFPIHEGYEDPQLSNFYGEAMPLVKRGVPVGITHIENVQYPATLKDVKVLAMSYSNLKPLEPSAHDYLAAWVKKGGVIVYSGRDNDPFQGISEWWNTGDYNFSAPSNHLFSKMGIQEDAPAGVYECGKGRVCIIRKDPKEYVLTEGGENEYIAAVKEMYKLASGKEMAFKNNLALSRGPYQLVAVMDESISSEPVELEGCYIDLFDPQLPVYSKITVEPGHQGYFYNVGADKLRKAKILAAASRAEQIVNGRKFFSFVAKSPVGTTNVSRIFIPKCPKSVTVNGSPVDAPWDEASRTLLLTFENDPEGVSVQINW